MEAVEWLAPFKRYTERLREHVEHRTLEETVAYAAQETNLSWDTVKEIDKARLRRLYEHFHWDNSRRLAVDEFARECQDFCVWGGYSRGSPTRLPFVFEMQYARPDAIAGAKVEGPARSAGGSSLAPAIARREAAGALAREV